MSSPAASYGEICKWCISFVAQLLEQDEASINQNTKFTRLGFDSTMAVELGVAIEERYGLTVDPEVLADHPTISQLAAFVAEALIHHRNS